MKSIVALLIMNVLLSVSSTAALITAVRNGAWASGTTWDAGRVPMDNDQVVIPASLQVSFNGTPYPKNPPVSRPTLSIKIYGILDFSADGNDKLYLNAGSIIQVLNSGKIQTTSGSNEIIAIYTGSSDNTVWTGSPATITGPSNATATTSLFSNAVLPVKLESFIIKKSNREFATLKWITSAEVNSSKFEIQSLTPAMPGWQFAGNVTASGNTATPREYHYNIRLVKGYNQFRLKQIDHDDKFTYSPVVSVSYDTENNMVIMYDQSTHQLLVKGLENQDGKIYITDASGRTVLAASVSTPITFQPESGGVYFVNLIKNHLSVSKKIMVH